MSSIANEICSSDERALPLKKPAKAIGHIQITTKQMTVTGTVLSPVNMDVKFDSSTNGTVVTQSAQPVLSPLNFTSMVRTPKYRDIKFENSVKLPTNVTNVNEPMLATNQPAHHTNMPVSDTVVLLSDSICKHIAHVWDLNVLAYPGTTVDEFLYRVKNNKIHELNKAAVTILHVGTNNLKDEEEKDVAMKVFQLATTIYDKYGCFIVISLILPRPDSYNVNQKAMKTNELIKAGINKKFMHCIFTYRIFITKSRINTHLYCHLDKIHPNQQGNRLLYKYYTTRVNEIRKALFIPKGQIPPPPKKVIRRGENRW